MKIELKKITVDELAKNYEDKAPSSKAGRDFT